MEKHSDCKHFISVDCAKGLCAWTNQMVVIDTPPCPRFEALPKCKICSNYHPDKDNMGTCTGLPDKSFWAYDEMIARNCPGFKANA